MKIGRRPVIDWSKFDPGKEKHQARVVAKLGEFFQAPYLATEKALAKLSELTAPGDTSSWDSIVNSITSIQEDVGDIDLGWQLAFNEVDLRNTNKSSFDITGVSSGLTFAKVRPGGAAKIYQVSGTNVNVKMDLYGGGLGWLRVWYDDQEYYKLDQEARDFLYKYGTQQAAIHYALITAVTTAITYDTTGSTTPEKDANTINATCADMIVDNDGVLPGINDNTPFLFYHYPTLKGRIAQAMNTVIPYTNQKLVSYNVRPVSTINVGSGYLGQLVAPGIKNQYGRRMDLTVYGDMDIVRYAETVVGWGRYGSYINAVQVRRVPSN